MGHLNIFYQKDYSAGHTQLKIGKKIYKDSFRLRRKRGIIFQSVEINQEGEL